MTDKSDDARQLAIFRRNNLWRHISSTSSQFGALNLVAAVVHPLYGFWLPWYIIVAMLVISTAAYCFTFFCLRFIDHSV